MPELSIIIPVYNVEKYLEECLLSIKNQKFKNFEVICVNDGSTDNSLNILRRFEASDPRFKVISQKNKGQSCARNSGLKAAQGKYVTFVDSDDILDSEAYSTVLTKIGNADIACFGIKVFGNINIEMRKSDNAYYRVKYNGKYTLNNDMRYNTDCSPCNKIFKKEIIDRYNIIFPEHLHYEDAAFYWKYILSVNSAFYIDKYFYKYRRRENSIMNSTFSGKSNFAIDHIYIIEDIYKFLKKYDLLRINSKLLETLFVDYVIFAYNYSTGNQKAKALQTAQNLAKLIFKEQKPTKNCVKNILKNKFSDIFEPDLKWFQKLFCVKNVYIPTVNMTKPFLYILGNRIKMRNKNEELINKINALHNEVLLLKEELNLK